MDVDWWNSFFQAGLIALTALTVVFGLGVLLTDKTIKGRQQLAIAEANERAATANRESARANERAGKVELEAAQLRERAAKTETKVSGIDDRTAPRVLTADNAAKLRAAITGVHGEITVSRLGDDEARKFGDQIVGTLKAAGWTLHLTGLGAMIPPRYGVFVSIRPTENPTPAVVALVEGLRSAGIEVTISRGRRFTGEADLLIALRPVK